MIPGTTADALPGLTVPMAALAMEDPMRLTSLSEGARSRFYFSLLTLSLSLVLIAAPLGGVSASEDARGNTGAEIDNGGLVDLPGDSGPDGVEHLDDGEGDEGDPIDVDFLTVLQLFLTTLRTFS